jgi:hypothetical protein
MEEKRLALRAQGRRSQLICRGANRSAINMSMASGNQWQRRRIKPMKNSFGELTLSEKVEGRNRSTRKRKKN